jgi:hypothetical protein
VGERVESLEILQITQRGVVLAAQIGGGGIGGVGHDAVLNVYFDAG